MKMTSTILSDFIYDFNLEVTEVGVCFDAVINFNLPMQNFNLQSEVHMEPVLSNLVDTIYLLNPMIEKYKMPTFFNDVNHQFLYLSNKGLIIAGQMQLFGSYSISMFPKNHRCSQATFDELRAKKLN
ncbi:MAG: hypothetical protein H7Z13_18390 [Ferruginibacter sp.]|nr:hypothetical protein [Ferruginibacter sp.]